MRQLLVAAASAALPLAALAIPSARVAFVQHGDDSLHIPAAAPSSMSPRQFGAAVARVLCLDAPAEPDFPLPASDIFHRPEANLIVFVDGLSMFGSSATPFLREALNAERGAYGLRPPAEEGWSSMLLSTLAPGHWDAAAPGAAGGAAAPVCVAMDPVLFATAACQGGQQGGNFWTPTDLSGRLTAAGIDARYDSAVEEWVVASLASDGDFETVVLEMKDPAVGAVFSEAELLFSLPERVAATGTAATAGAGAGKAALPQPPLAIAYVSSLKAMAAEYGEGSAVVAAAAAILDGAIAAAAQAPAVAAAAASGGGGGQRLFSTQVVAGRTLSDVMPMWRTGASRRLDDASNSTSSSANYTQADINQYQINLWTAVALAMAVFASVAALVNMDIGRDSLLYAKFQADVGGLKTD